MVALGLLWAYYALAQGPESVTYISHVDYNQNTFFNTSGFPDEKSWDAFQARPKTNLVTHSWSARCSCVIYVKQLIGFTAPVGAARNFPVNTSVCTPGAVVVFTSGIWGHVALVDSCSDTTGTIRTESNQTRCTITYGRTFLLNRPDIKGYYIP